jgi:TldD protein
MTRASSHVKGMSMSELQLPSAMATLRPHLGEVVAAVEARAPYGAVLLMAQEGVDMFIDNREERVSETPRSAGVTISAFDGMTMYEQAISGFDRLAVERAARELTADHSFANRSVDPGPARQGDFSTPIASLSMGEKLERCHAVHRRVQNLDPRIVSVRVMYMEGDFFTVFRNRTADLAQRLTRARLAVFVLVSGPDGVRYDYAIKTSAGDWEALELSDEELHNLVANAVALLSAERITPGEYTIVTAPAVTGVIAHESFGHGVETDMFLKQRARAAQFGSYFFDEEGQLAASTTIVENGIFKRGLTDLYSATALNIPRSANGRRQDFSRKAYARMSNTFFQRGTTPVADLFAQVEHGLYLKQVSSGMEDPQGWGIQVTCHYGHEIKNGQLTDRLYAPIGITGYVPDVLQTVSAVGNDLELTPGFCGKGHKERVLVTSGGPHLLLTARLG